MACDAISHAKGIIVSFIGLFNVSFIGLFCKRDLSLNRVYAEHTSPYERGRPAQCLVWAVMLYRCAAHGRVCSAYEPNASYVLVCSPYRMGWYARWAGMLGIPHGLVCSHTCARYASIRAHTDTCRYGRPNASYGLVYSNEPCAAQLCTAYEPNASYGLVRA